MLEGITILNQSTGSFGLVIAMSGLIIVGFIIVVKLFPYALDNWDSEIAVFSTVVIGAGIMVAGTVGAINALTDVSITKYEVTISDEVSFKDFEEHYEIVDKNGDIYTIIEKDS